MDKETIDLNNTKKPIKNFDKNKKIETHPIKVDATKQKRSKKKKNKIVAPNIAIESKNTNIGISHPSEWTPVTTNIAPNRTLIDELLESQSIRDTKNQKTETKDHKVEGNNNPTINVENTRKHFGKEFYNMVNLVRSYEEDFKEKPITGENKKPKKSLILDMIVNPFNYYITTVLFYSIAILLGIWLVNLVLKIL